MQDIDESWLSGPSLYLTAEEEESSVAAAVWFAGVVQELPVGPVPPQEKKLLFEPQ